MRKNWENLGKVRKVMKIDEEYLRKSEESYEERWGKFEKCEESYEDRWENFRKSKESYEDRWGKFEEKWGKFWK